jgi:hypothetical protein
MKYNSKKYNELRKSPELRNWTKSVLERDNYTCQKCSSTDMPSAHHIKSFLKYPKLRFDINNGITLCISCHISTESYGGLRKYMKNKGILLNWPTSEELKIRRADRKFLKEYLENKQREYDEKIRLAMEKARATRARNKALRMITG